MIHCLITHGIPCEYHRGLREVTENKSDMYLKVTKQNAWHIVNNG